MCTKEMPFGHSGSQAPVFEQSPNPSSFGSATGFFVHRIASNLYEIKTQPNKTSAVIQSTIIIFIIL